MCAVAPSCVIDYSRATFSFNKDGKLKASKMAHNHSHGGGCHDEHDHGHDHELPEGVGHRDNLYARIDRANVVAMNAEEPGKGPEVIKPWDKRLDEEVVSASFYIAPWTIAYGDTSTWNLTPTTRCVAPLGALTYSFLSSFVSSAGSSAFLSPARSSYVLFCSKRVPQTRLQRKSP